MYKVGRFTYIGTKEKLDNGDVIQVGNLGLKYKVRKLKKMDDRYWHIYEIKRIDGNLTTGLDINATKVGQKVLIVSRQTFQQIFNWAESLREENPICPTVCGNDSAPCDDQEPRTFTVEQEQGPAPVSCKQYNITIPSGVGDRSTRYLDCEGKEQTVVHPDTKTSFQIIICTRDINSVVHIEYVPVSITESGDC